MARQMLGGRGRSTATPSPQPNPAPARPPARQAAAPIQRPAPQRAPQNYFQRSGGGGGNPGGGSPGGFFSSGGPGGGGGPGGDMSSFSVDSGVPSEEDYLKGDSSYQATLSALARQLQSFQADIDTQRGNRKLDYDKAVKDLGYIKPGDGGQANWNWDDVLTASGRAYQNNSNDYAARGMLQSQGYADSVNNLQRSLMDQYTGIDQSNTQFNSDLDRQLTKTKDENTAASQAARAEAIMRRAAQYGFGV